jgi:hypothetical protein
LSTPSTTIPTNVRVLWVLVSVLFSIVVAMVAGILTAEGGETIVHAFLYGGGAFGGTMALCLAVLKAVRVL